MEEKQTEKSEIIGGECTEDDCPKIYAPTDNNVRVQGYVRTDMTAPDGEAIVEIPVSVLLEAARALGG
jgi:hypothetical protein